MTVELDTSGCTIVLVGQFNPAIFHPSWFLSHNLINEATAAESQVHVVHPDIAQMELGPVSWQAEQQRVTISTTSAPLIRVADLAVSVFGKLLTHTPIAQVGINTHRHYRLSSAEVRHEFGRRLAPIGPWGEWGHRLDTNPMKDSKSGVQIIAMREYWADPPWAGYIQVKVEPSTKIGHDSGVYVEKNHHIDRMAPRGDVAAAEFVQYTAKRFDDVIAESDWIEKQLFADI